MCFGLHFLSSSIYFPSRCRSLLEWMSPEILASASGTMLDPEVPSRGEAGFDVEDIVKILGEPTRSDLSEEKEWDGRSRICLNRPQDPGKWGSLPALPATWSATWPAMQA